MKNILLIFFIILLLCACISTNSQISLYRRYETLITTIENKNYDYALNMFSSETKNGLTEAYAPNEFGNYFRFFSVNTTITNETVHYQNIGLFKACLTINGFTEDNKPATIHFSFLNEKGDWKLDYIHKIFHESKNDFPQTASCPKRPKF